MLTKRKHNQKLYQPKMIYTNSNEDVRVEITHARGGFKIEIN